MTKSISGKTRESILEKAAICLAELPGASMAEIAIALNIGRATLYRHFPSRDELIRALALEAIRLTDEAAAKIPETIASYREAFELLIAETLPFGDRYHFLMNEPKTQSDPQVKAEVDRQNQELLDMIEAAKAAGEIDASVSSHWIAASYDALIWAAWYSVHQGKVAKIDAPKLAMKSFWPGIATQ